MMGAMSIDVPALQLSWSETPWDSALFGFPVWHIDRMRCGSPRAAAASAFAHFEAQRAAAGCRFASSRIGADLVEESLLLQQRGFCLIETLYNPEIDLSGACESATAVQLLEAHRAAGDEVPALAAIAGAAFGHERFHVDPRVPRGLGDQRYRNWVQSVPGHSSQRLFALRDGSRTVAFFVTELLPDGTCFWHLNAVEPALQGRGYGPRAWATMIHVARNEGALRVRSAIVARNVRVLNLYARLGFRFLPPLCTYHWAAPD